MEDRLEQELGGEKWMKNNGWGNSGGKVKGVEDTG